jgi:hypothetical protein
MGVGNHRQPERRNGHDQESQPMNCDARVARLVRAKYESNVLNDSGGLLMFRFALCAAMIFPTALSAADPLTAWDMTPGTVLTYIVTEDVAIDVSIPSIAGQSRSEATIRLTIHRRDDAGLHGAMRILAYKHSTKKKNGDTIAIDTANGKSEFYGEPFPDLIDELRHHRDLSNNSETSEGHSDQSS